MGTEKEEVKHKDLTEKIIGIFFEVYNRLGYGFLEKVYENSMLIEFENESVPVVPQAPITVFCDGKVVGE
jgi:GxxExxY protein